MRNAVPNAAVDVPARYRDKIVGREISLPPTDRIYFNGGNPPLMNLLSGEYHRVLDIGCGAGNNAALIKLKTPECEVFGITHSSSEAELALAHMRKCWVGDIESEFPDDLADQSFDVLIFSHVLEHLRYPDAVVANFSRLLRQGGQVLIAIPNVLGFKTRLKFLRGNFEYEPSGVMDDTHLHFYTYLTADRYLLAKSPDLKLSVKTVTGNFPLPLLRGHVIPRTLGERIDEWGVHHWPNLFGHQVLIRAVKQ